MHYHMWRSYKTRLHMHACIDTVHVSIEKYVTHVEAQKFVTFACCIHA